MSVAGITKNNLVMADQNNDKISEQFCEKYAKFISIL